MSLRTDLDKAQKKTFPMAMKPSHKAQSQSRESYGIKKMHLSETSCDYKKWLEVDKRAFLMSVIYFWILQ